MRHSLGLRSDLSVRPANDRPTNPTIGTHSQRRRFVRDGEVPVTVIRRDHQPDDEHGTNQLDAARKPSDLKQQRENTLNDRWETRRF